MRDFQFQPGSHYKYQKRNSMSNLYNIDPYTGERTLKPEFRNLQAKIKTIENQITRPRSESFEPVNVYERKSRKTRKNRKANKKTRKARRLRR